MAKQRRVKVREANRRMVSLPAELNRRMAQTDGVNWSAIAVRAWEQEFGRLAEQKEEKDVTDIVDRLRASKRQSESEFYKDGVSAANNGLRERRKLLNLSESST